MHLNPASSFRFANNLENKFRTVSLYMNRFHFRCDVCLVLRLYKSKKICTEKSRHVLLHLSMHIHVCLFSLTSKNILTLPLIFIYIPLFTYMQIPLFTKMSYSLSLSLSIPLYLSLYLFRPHSDILWLIIEDPGAKIRRVHLLQKLYLSSFIYFYTSSIDRCKDQTSSMRS